MAARGHERVHGAAQVDVSEEFEVPCLAPTRLIDGCERSAGDCARVVDEDVDLACRFDERLLRCAVRQVVRVNGDGDLVGACDRVAGFDERLGPPRRQVQVNPFGRHRLRDGTSNSLRPAGYQGGLS